MTLLDGQSEVFRIYKFTNTTNFKMYIGITAMTLERRWIHHVSAAKRGSKTRFHQAIAKHGKESFSGAVLEEVIGSDAAKDAEIKWIAHFGTYDHGYNMTLGGDFHDKHTEETKAKIAATSKRRWSDPSVAESMKLQMRVALSSPDAKANKSAASKRRRGEKRSADGVANITEAQRKRWSDPAQRQAARDKSLAAWARKKGGDHAVA